MVPSQSKFPSSIILAHITYYLRLLAGLLASVYVHSRPFATQQPEQSFRYMSLLGILQWLPSSLRVKAKLHLIVLWPSLNLDSSYSLHASHTELCAALQTDQMEQPSWSKICSLECPFSALHIGCSLVFEVLA